MFFLELSCFSHDPADDGNLLSGSSAFSKTNLNVWEFTGHVLLKPGLENFEHGGSDDKASACNAGELGSVPGLGRSPGEGNSNPLQHSGLENPMDRGA